MAREQDVQFVSSSIKIPRSSFSHPVPPLLLGHHNLSFHLDRARDAIQGFVASLRRRCRPCFLCSSSLAVARPEVEPNPRRHGKEDEERILISEVLIRHKGGEPLERADLEAAAAAAAAAAMKSCRPHSALTVQEEREDVHRIIESGYLPSCMPVAVDTRDGFPLVFLVYNRLQGKRDVETILTMGIMEDVVTIPQPTGDPCKVDLVMNLVEHPSGGFSAGGGISGSGMTNGPLTGLIGSFAYSHWNVFGRNQKLNLSLERGQIDLIFCINYIDPWIEGDNKRTSRTIMFQNSRTLGALVHGNNQSDHGGLMIARVTAGIEYGRTFRPKWNGTVGLIVQHAVALDNKGNPVIRDIYNSPLTASVSRGHLIGNFPPHEAFAIGGTNSVRGYEEGAVGSGRSYMVCSAEILFHMTFVLHSVHRDQKTARDR